jgi:hypothetical protein
MTRGVVPLRLCVTCRLTCSRCLPCLFASQAALTPSANPPGKSGLHHSHLALLHGRAMASQAGRFVLRLLVPGLVMPANSARRHSPGFERTPMWSQADRIVKEAIRGPLYQATVDGRWPPSTAWLRGLGWPDSDRTTALSAVKMLRNPEQRPGRSRAPWLVRHARRSLRI